MNPIPVLLFLAAAAAASTLSKKLTPPAALTGALTGALIYFGSGYTGLTLLAVFFLLGTAVTSSQSTRHTGQVLANAGVAAILSALALFVPALKPLFLLMIAAAMSSATADTLSSELGMAYGRRFFNILTGRADQKGLDGVISIEGLLFGITGSAIISTTYSLFTSHWGRHFMIILIAGTLGNLADSVLGAVFERRGRLSNDGVNFINTLLAALCAAALTFV